MTTKSPLKWLLDFAFPSKEEKLKRLQKKKRDLELDLEIAKLREEIKEIEKKLEEMKSDPPWPGDIDLKAFRDEMNRSKA